MRFNSYAQEPEPAGLFFTKAEMDVVLNNELITKGYLKNKKTVYTPNTDTMRSIPASRYLKGDMGSYEMLCVEKAFFKYELTDSSKLMLFNTLVACSKLSGMKYYSRLEKKIKPAIFDCYRIESPADPKRIDDLTYGKVLPNVVTYFKIKDNRFGALMFRSELYNEGNNFILKNVCIQPLVKYFISVNKSEQYQLVSFFIYDSDARGYFYYSVNAMKINSGYLLKFGVLSPVNFANRIRGSTVHVAKLLGLDWQDRLSAFEPKNRN
jgi:hypothetical protein